VVQSVLRFLRYDLALRDLPITFTADGPRVASIDPRSFRQVIINLVRNAAQATKRGEGRIAVRVGGAGNHVTVEVEDNGCGISSEVANRIFEPFFSTKGDDGLGLGLDISRKIVTDHEGSLTFSSEVGRGTTFRIELPARP
jgi:two-component system NtrC family sensor kinase